MLMNMVEKTLNERRLVSENDRIIVALSGGADSICLLDILYKLKKKYGFILYAAHLNHQIRGVQAHRDVLFCADICDRLEIPFFVKSVNVPSYAEEKKMTMEEAARECRYRFLLDLKSELKADKVAVAHNMDDQVETILMRIIRGTGLYGLKGMDYRLSNGVIRPLLDIGKTEIIDYLKQCNLSWCDDGTNEETVYTRNKIRLHLLPLMEEFSPKVRESIVRMSTSLREDSFHMESAAYELFRESSYLSDKVVKLDCDILCQHSPSMKKREIRYAIKEVRGSLKGIESIHLDDVLSLTENPKSQARLDLPGGLKIYKKQNFLYFTMEELKETEIAFTYSLGKNDRVYISELGMEITTKTIAKAKCLVLPTGQYTKAFDLDKIKGTIIVRNRQVGDKIRPMGLGGTKKLKNIFIDEKIPIEQRDRVPIITDSEDNIIWVVGSCISEDFKIDENTKNVIRIGVKEISIQNGGIGH